MVESLNNVDELCVCVCFLSQDAAKPRKSVQLATVSVSTLPEDFALRS